MKALKLFLKGEQTVSLPAFLRGMCSTFDIAGTENFIPLNKQPLSEETHFSGPIPEPELLKAYNEVVPGLADRIFRMAKDEQEHRFLVERRKVRAIARGQYTAFIIVILLIVAGVTCALCGQHVVAGTIFATTIIGTASVFLLGKRTGKEK